MKICGARSKDLSAIRLSDVDSALVSTGARQPVLRLRSSLPPQRTHLPKPAVGSAGRGLIDLLSCSALGRPTRRGVPPYPPRRDALDCLHLRPLPYAQIKQGLGLLEVGKGLRLVAEKSDWTEASCGETVSRLTFRGVEGIGNGR